MKIEVDITNMKRNNLLPDQYLLLYFIYNKEFELIEKIYTRTYALMLRDQLVSTKYVLGKQDVPFKQTILSSANVCKLLGIRDDKINFVDFYHCYPIRVASRVLRASNVSTIEGRRHEKKYLEKVKTIEDHQMAIKATEAFIAAQNRAGNLTFLPAIETVINGAKWQSWEVLITEQGAEELDWNAQTI